MRYTILLGGDLLPTERLRRQTAGTRAIAADSGIRHAAALGLDVDLWVGDFDSADGAARTAYADIPVRTFPHEKDMTDGELAVAEALGQGATALVFAGAFGGARVDHTYLHLAMAVKLAEDGVEVLLSSGSEEGVPLLPGREAGFDYPSGTMFSVIAFGDLDALTLTGAKWPLARRVVPFGSSLTISNEVAGPLTAHLGAGRAVLVAQCGEVA